MNPTLRRILILSTISAAIIAVGVIKSRDPHERSGESIGHTNDHLSVNENNIVKAGKIKNFGCGIYYFQFTGDEFRSALSAFLATHPNLEVITSDGDVVRQNRWNDDHHQAPADYGVTVGHTVIFRDLTHSLLTEKTVM